MVTHENVLGISIIPVVVGPRSLRHTPYCLLSTLCGIEMAIHIIENRVVNRQHYTLALSTVSFHFQSGSLSLSPTSITTHYSFQFRQLGTLPKTSKNVPSAQMVRICAVLASFQAQITDNFNLTIGPSICIDPSKWGQSGSVWSRRYLRVSRVVLIFVQHLIINLSESLRDLMVNSMFYQNLAFYSFNPYSTLECSWAGQCAVASQTSVIREIVHV